MQSASEQSVVQKRPARKRPASNDVEPDVLGLMKLRRRTLRVGTDFSGTESPIITLKNRLKIDIQHEFSSDIAPCARKLIQEHFKPRVFYPDIKEREPSDPPKVDLYVFSAPCGPFSSAGLQQGLYDLKERGDLIFYSLMYIKEKRPAMALSENVAGLVSFRAYLELVLDLLDEWGYTTKWQVLNTMDYGLPQSRPRFYLQAVRNDLLVKPLEFPPPLPWKIPFSVIVKSNVHAMSFRQYPKIARERNIVKQQYAKIQAKGEHMFVKPCAIDAKASEKFAGHAIDGCMCLTKTRCEQFGYWVSTKGGWMSLEEMEILQGFNDGEVPWKSCGITKNQWAGMLGNSLSINVISQILPHLFRSAGFCTEAQFSKMIGNSGWHH